MNDAQAIWRCTCGAVAARVAPVKGTRCICYCRDCQAFLAHLGRHEVADEAGGTDLFQTMPHQVTFTKGAENLAALRLSDKGPLRWYTTCCNTPVANTGASRTLPLASMPVAFFEDAAPIGPVVARVNRKGAKGHVAGEAGSVRRLIAAFLGRAALTLVTGRYRSTPFFEASGAPVAEPKRLTAEERAKAYGG